MTLTILSFLQECGAVCFPKADNMAEPVFLSSQQPNQSPHEALCHAAFRGSRNVVFMFTLKRCIDKHSCVSVMVLYVFVQITLRNINICFCLEAPTSDLICNWFMCDLNINFDVSLI